MPPKVILVDAKSGTALHTEAYRHEGKMSRVLLITDRKAHYGVFKSTALGAVATTILGEPEGDGSVELTDLIVSAEKKTAGVITVQFNDGVNTEPVSTSYTADAPVNFAIGINGRWQGWQGAWIEVAVTGAAALGSVGVGFIKNLKADSLDYATWNARR